MAPEQTARFERKKEMRHRDADAFSLLSLENLKRERKEAENRA